MDNRSNKLHNLSVTHESESILEKSGSFKHRPFSLHPGKVQLMLFCHVRESWNCVVGLTTEQLSIDAGRGQLDVGRIRGLPYCLPMSHQGFELEI